MDATYTIDELEHGIELPTGQRHRLRVLYPKLRVRLAIDPNDAKSRDDRFTLRSDDASSRYSRVLTIKDDLIEGDQFIDLLFERLVPNLSYSLEVDTGNEGEKYMAFERLGWEKLEPIVYRSR